MPILGRLFCGKHGTANWVNLAEAGRKEMLKKDIQPRPAYLKWVYIGMMTIGFVDGGGFPLPWFTKYVLQVGVLGMAMLFMLVTGDFRRLKTVGQFAVMFGLPFVMMASLSMLYWALDFQQLNYMSRGCSTILYHVISLSAMCGAVYLFGRRSIDYTFYAMCAGNTGIVLMSIKTHGVAEYYPTEYTVKLTVGSSRSAEFARLMLDEILSCYFASFGEKYVDYSTIPNNAENVLAGGYDYIEQAEILSNSMEEIIAQLGSRQSAAPNFTSSRTGLSVSDLFDEYSYIQSVRIPYLFSEILGEKLTQDREILLKKYQERYANYTLTSGTDGDKVASVKEVIASYGNKNKEGSLYYAGTNGTDTNGQNGLVLNDVYEEYDEDGKIKDRTTVYDTLISDYVTLLNRKSDSLIDAAYCQYIIDTFSEAPDATENTDEARASVEAEISALQSRLDDLYQVLLVTMEEYNEYMGAVNVGVLSTTAVSARVNVKLYMMLGVVVFFILGVCGAILLGRIQDFVEYLFFTEQSLEMPNRTACDLYIKNNTERVLGDDNVCVVLELTNLSHINNELGRVKGNEVLRRFADFIKEASATCGTVYYNGGWQFIGFFEQCRREDAESFADYMHRLVHAYNAENGDAKMEYSLGMAESRTDNAHTLRTLLRSAMIDRRKQED